MAVGRALSAACGQAVSCSVETVDWDLFRGEAACVRSGYLYNAFGASEQYVLSLVFPEAFTARWTGALARTEPDLDKARLPAELISRVAEGLAMLIRLNVDADDGRAAVQPFSAFPKKCAARDVEELLWRAAGCRIFRLSPISGSLPEGMEETGAEPGGALYILIDAEEADRLAAGLDGDDLLRTAAGRLVGAAGGEAGGAEDVPRIEEAPAPRSIAVRFPRELVLGNFLLLPKVPCGRFQGEVRFHEILAGADPRSYAAAPGVWARLSCSLTLSAAPGAAPLQPRLWAVHLFFPSQAQEPCRQVASCFFQAELGFLKGVLGAVPSQTAVGMGLKPDFTAGKGLAVFRGRIGVAGTRMPVDALLDYGTVSWLLRLFCDPWDAQNAPKGAEAVLPLLLSLNQSLLRRWLPTFHRRFLDIEPAAEPGGQPGERLPFPVFLDLLGDRDARLVLQNCVLQSLGDRDIRSLYRCAVRGKDAEGRESVRVVTPRLFDEARLKGFLSRRALEDWQIAAPDRLASPEESRDLSDAALKGVREAVQRKQILVSPKVPLILEKMFLPGARGAAKRKLEQAALFKEPFESLQKMPRPALQQFLGVQSNRALCLVLVGAEKGLPLIRENISRNKRRTLDEDLEIQKRLAESNELDADEVIEAKLRMGRQAQVALEALEKSGNAAPMSLAETSRFRVRSLDGSSRKGRPEEIEDDGELEQPRTSKPARPGAPRGAAPGAPPASRPGSFPPTRPGGLGAAAASAAARPQKPGPQPGSTKPAQRPPLGPASRPPQGPARGGDPSGRTR